MPAMDIMNINIIIHDVYDAYGADTSAGWHDCITTRSRGRLTVYTINTPIFSEADV